MQQDNQPNPGSPQDFEMGGDEEAPKINNYQKDQPKSQGEVTPMAQPGEHKPSIDPTTAPPPNTPKQVPPTAPQGSPQPTQTPSPTFGVKPTNAPPRGRAPIQNPSMGVKPMTPGAPKGSSPLGKAKAAAKKKALIGCMGGFIGLVIIILILSFIFIAGAGTETENPIAKILGVNQASFVNGLITLVNFTFLLVALVSFIFTMIGLFKASMAKKDDNITRKKGLKTSLIAGFILIFILITWMFVYLYLDTQRVFENVEEILPPITTEPEDTLNLTAPIEIRFDASHVPFDSNKYQIISYRWDFGDEETGTNQIVAHTYEDKGDDGRFDVLLTITRRDKDTGEEFQDQYSKIITIANQALSAIFTVDPQSGEAPLKVKFDASESVDPDGNIDIYEWDFDEDGEYDDADGATASHTFEKIGTYTVALRVTSTTGDFSVVEKDIKVEEEASPDAIITIKDEPQIYLVDEQYIFKSDESTSPNGKIEEYEWDFGDGTRLEKTKTASHTYKKSGSYEIILTVIDEEGKDGEVRKKITVGTPKGSPKASIETEPAIKSGALSLSGSIPFTVVFDASTSSDTDNDIVDYEWDFDGDGVIDEYGALASFTYNEEGNFTATLNVVDADGNSGSESISIKVSAQGILAKIQTDKLEGSVPLIVSFDASGSSYPDGQIVSYNWEFGDNSSPKLGSSKINHKYTTIGNFTATVTVIGSDNSSNTATILITVREIALSACFKTPFESGKAPLITSFDPGCSSGTISSYFWDFGDGNTSTQVKPSHTFNTPGTYPVKLEITDIDNTVDTSERIITVTE